MFRREARKSRSLFERSGSHFSTCDEPVYGFSLIELLIAVTVLCVISLIAVPSYEWAMRKSRRAEGKTLLYSIMAAQEQFYTRNNRYADRVEALGMTGPVQSVPGGFYTLSRMALSDDKQTLVVDVAPQKAQARDVCGVLSLDSVGRWHAGGRDLPDCR